MNTLVTSRSQPVRRKHMLGIRSLSKMSRSSAPLTLEQMGPVARSMYEKLSSAFSPSKLDIVDDSHLHAGHAAMKGLNPSETHFTVNMVSEKFAGVTPVERHRMVYSTLSEELDGPVHALSLKLKPPPKAT